MFCLLSPIHNCIASSILYDTLAVATQFTSYALPFYYAYNYINLHNKNSDLEVRKDLFERDVSIDGKIRCIELLKIEHKLNALFEFNKKEENLPLVDLLLRTCIIYYWFDKPHASLLPLCANIVTLLPCAIEHTNVNCQYQKAKKKADQINFDNLDDHFAAECNDAFVNRLTGKKVKKIDGQALDYIQHLRRFNIRKIENRESNYQPIDYRSQLLLVDKHRISQGKKAMPADALCNIAEFCSQPYQPASKEKIASIKIHYKEHIGGLDKRFYRKFRRSRNQTR